MTITPMPLSLGLRDGDLGLSTTGQEICIAFRGVTIRSVSLTPASATQGPFTLLLTQFPSSIFFIGLAHSCTGVGEYDGPMATLSRNYTLLVHTPIGRQAPQSQKVAHGLPQLCRFGRLPWSE